MIEFYRKPGCNFCDDVQRRLEGLVLAHRVHSVQADDAKRQDIPFVTEGRRKYRGEEEIQSFMEEISRETIIQREMQSDSCKIDPETGLAC